MIDSDDSENGEKDFWAAATSSPDVRHDISTHIYICPSSKEHLVCLREGPLTWNISPWGYASEGKGTLNCYAKEWSKIYIFLN